MRMLTRPACSWLSCARLFVTTARLGLSSHASAELANTGLVACWLPNGKHAVISGNPPALNSKKYGLAGCTAVHHRPHLLNYITVQLRGTHERMLTRQLLEPKH